MNKINYYQLNRKNKDPETADELEYIIKKLYRQLNNAYTKEEAIAIIDEIYKVKSKYARKENEMWH